MKRTPLKKKSSATKLKRKLWEVFSLYIKQRDKFKCFTCDRFAEGQGMHAGHFVPKSVGGLALYFHEENVHAQCYNCNINLSGNQYEYGKRLGNKAEELYKLKGTIIKGFPYEEKIEYYTKKLSTL